MADMPIYTSSEITQPAPMIDNSLAWRELEKAGSQIERAGVYAENKEETLKLQTNRYTVGADLLQHSNKLLTQAEQMPDPEEAMKFYNKGMDGLAQGTLQTIPKGNEGYARNMLAHLSNSGNTQLNKRILKSQDNDLHMQFSNNQTVYTNEMSNSLHNGDVNAGMTWRAHAEHGLFLAKQSGRFSTAELTTQQANISKQFNQQHILGQYIMAAKKDQGKEFRKGFMASKAQDANFSASGKQNMIKMFDAYDKQTAAEAGITEATYSDYKDSALYNASHGIPQDQEQLGKMLNAYPKKAKQFTEQLQDNSKEWLDYSTASKGTQAQIEEKVDSLIDPTAIPSSNRQYQVNLKVAKRLQAFEKAAKNDPQRIYRNDPAFKAEFKKQSSTNSNPWLANEINVKMQKAKGIRIKDIRGMENSEAHTVVENIKSFPLGEQPKKIMDFLNQVPEKLRPFVSKDLQRAKLPQASQYVLRMGQFAESRPYVNDAVIAWSQPNGIADYAKYLATSGDDATTSASLMQVVGKADSVKDHLSALYAMGGNVGNTINTFLGKAQLLTAQIMRRHGVKSDIAADMAGEAMTAGLTNDTFRGQPLFYPSDLEEGIAQQGMSYLSNKAVSSDVRIGAGVRSQHPGLMEDQLKKTYLAGSYFVTSSDQRSLILMDASGRVVKDAKGNDFSLPFDKLRDHSSSLYNSITNYHGGMLQDFYNSQLLITPKDVAKTAKFAKFVGII